MLFSEPKIPQFLDLAPVDGHHPLFQCSSASRKFLNFVQAVRPARVDRERFSALQRAENSSMWIGRVECAAFRRFSALQRAENSSIGGRTTPRGRRRRVSVLFSEPKIPQ